MKESAEEVISRRKRQEKLERIKRERVSRFKKSVTKVANTGDGQLFLYYLMKECGYQMPSVVTDGSSGKLLMDSTIYNEARRDIYLRVRNLLKDSPELLKKIEIDMVNEERKDG